MRLPKTRKILAAAAATSALLMTAACGSDAADDTSSSATSSAPSTSTDDTTDTADSTSEYADGTYEAEGSYTNPGGLSSVSVSLTLQDGVVSDLDVTPEASGTSLQYQQKFVSGINDEVVGKSLDEISVSKVSGSSLTSQGFNAALDEIKSEASA